MTRCRTIRAGQSSRVSEAPRNPTIPNLRAKVSAHWRCLGLPKAFWDAGRYHQKYREKNRERARRYAIDWRQRNPNYVRKQPGRERLRILVHELKSKTPCADCGQIYPACCMDFDHLPGHQKVGGVAEMLWKRISEKELREEIAKCELVCANCHRIRTHHRASTNVRLARVAAT